jgi:CRP-like cAMP-binding protein
MNLEELTHLELLRSIDLFAGLSSVQLRKLAYIANRAEFARNELIYSEGDIGTSLYIIITGEVTIEMAMPAYGTVTLYTLIPKQLFGWSSLIAGRQKRARARATMPTKTLLIESEKIYDLFRTDHHLESALMNCIINLMADRMYLTRTELIRMAARFQPMAA